jgi:hypothetical protein
MTSFKTEAIANLMPFGHAANALELANGDIFVVWYYGSYEGSEDQRIAGAVLRADGSWQPTQRVVDRFEYDGETWCPEIGVPLTTPDGQLALCFWACPLSSFRLVQNPIRLHPSGGSGGGSWFALPTFEGDDALIWTRDISESRVFWSVLNEARVIEPPSLLTDERGLVVMGAARRLRSGRWLLPYHTETKALWFRSRFFLSDEQQTNWQSRADIYAEPGCLEPVAVERPNGDILCYMRRGGYGGHIWRSVSKDGGETFTSPEPTNLRNPHAGIDLGLSHTTGRLLLVYNDSYRLRTPLTVGISDDDGQTFRMRDVEVAQGSYAYPKLVQDRAGLWHLFYTNNYRHIQHASFDEAWLEKGRPMLA